jgi:hypothetical protein
MKKSIFWASFGLLFIVPLFYFSVAKADGALDDPENGVGDQPVQQTIKLSRVTKNITTDLHGGALVGFVPQAHYISWNGRNWNYWENLPTFTDYNKFLRYDIDRFIDFSEMPISRNTITVNGDIYGGGLVGSVAIDTDGTNFLSPIWYDSLNILPSVSNHDFIENNISSKNIYGGGLVGSSHWGSIVHVDNNYFYKNTINNSEAIIGGG